jgi:hypothetical protein
MNWGGGGGGRGAGIGWGYESLGEIDQEEE